MVSVISGDDNFNSDLSGLKTVNGNSLVGSGDIEFKTVNGNSLVGSGDISAGASTTFGAVGTYIWGRPQTATSYNTGATASGLKSAGSSSGNAYWWIYNNTWRNSNAQTAVSGTWRAMTPMIHTGTTSDRYSGLWVRIS